MTRYTPGTENGEVLEKAEFNLVSAAIDGLEAKVDLRDLVGWDDYLVSSMELGKSVDSPTFEVFKDNIYQYAFPDNAVKEGFGNVHILHDIDTATALIYPHIHWSSNEATPTGNVAWKIDVIYARGHRGEAFSTQETIALPPQACDAQYAHMISENVLTLINCEPDMLVLLRLYRDTADVLDTLTGDAFVFRADFHVKVNGRSTNEKAAPFTSIY